jgi:hypothetical protein
MKTLDIVLDGLMARYRAHVPDVGAIIDAMIAQRLIQRAEDIENDHIAFRTLGVRHLGIASLEKIFLRCGYRRRDLYDFPAKKLSAFWYEPPEPAHPRIFISELRVNKLTEGAQSVIGSYVREVASDPVDSLDLDDGPAVVEFLHRPLWRTPTWADYQRLLSESEYAAWVIYNRYYLNHFTIAVHNLRAGCHTIEEFNRFLEGQGFTLNDSGGKAKVSADGKLVQSSTVAAMVDAAFSDGRGGTENHAISGSYVEFAERKVLDAFAHVPADQIRREHRREGFEAASADKIFESTYTTQTKKRDAGD